MSLQTLTLNLSLNVHIGTDGTATVSLNTDNNRPITPAQAIVETPKQQKRSAQVAETKPELKPATIVTQEQEQSVQETVIRAFDEVASKAVTPPPPPPPPAMAVSTAQFAQIQQAVTPPPPVQPAPVTQAQPAVTPPPPPPPPAPTAPVAQTQPAVTPPPPPPPPVQPAPVTQAQPAVTPPPPPPVKTPTPEELQQAYEAQKSWTPRPPEPEPTLAEVNGYMPQPMATQPPPSPAVDEAAVTRDSNIRATAAALFGGHH